MNTCFYLQVVCTRMECTRRLPVRIAVCTCIFLYIQSFLNLLHWIKEIKWLSYLCGCKSGLIKNIEKQVRMLCLFLFCLHRMYVCMVVKNLLCCSLSILLNIFCFVWYGIWWAQMCLLGIDRSSSLKKNCGWKKILLTMSYRSYHTISEVGRQWASQFVRSRKYQVAEKKTNQELLPLLLQTNFTKTNISTTTEDLNKRNYSKISESLWSSWNDSNCIK